MSKASQFLLASAEYGSGSYVRHIQTAFAASSQALLHLLQHDLGLNHTLAALKHYFLLDKGDLLLSFLDSAEEELAKPAAQVSIIRLQSLLDLGEILLLDQLSSCKALAFSYGISAWPAVVTVHLACSHCGHRGLHL